MAVALCPVTGYVCSVIVGLQTQYDLWTTRDTDLRSVKRLVPA